MALPLELVRMVLVELRASAPLHHLLNSVLCCRRWSLVSLPLLYEHVFLDDRRLKLFVERVTPENTALMRTLTLEVSLYPRSSWPCTVLRAAHGLQSLSLLMFVLPAEVERSTSVDEERLLTITEVLHHLPKQCVSLELDTLSELYDVQHQPGKHLCPLIATVLPRLRHLRLRLGSICTRIFGPGLESGDSLYGPAGNAISNLVTVCLQCDMSWLCPAELEPNVLTIVSPALVKMTEAALAQIEHGRLPKVEELCVVDCVRSNEDERDQLAHLPIFRIDCVRKQMWAMPWCRIEEPGEDDEPFFTLGLPDCPDAAVAGRNLIHVGEGLPWHRAQWPRGCRLPASVISSDPNLATDPASLWQTRAAFIHEHPFRSCELWRSERLTGLRLLEPILRLELDNFCPVRQRVPPGWMAELVHSDHDETVVSSKLRLDDGESCRVLADDEVHCPHGFTLDLEAW